jgi:DNA-binding XRE family transcriptional regulator
MAKKLNILQLKLRELRKTRSQKAIALDCAVTRMTVYNWERGWTVPREKLTHIAAALGLGVDDLIELAMGDMT